MRLSQNQRVVSRQSSEPAGRIESRLSTVHRSLLSPSQLQAKHEQALIAREADLRHEHALELDMVQKES